ncbi:MAG TPA: HAD family hydrolase [Nitrospirae bacterium]|nr:HAD family hydrolase [Nitrospirota bacterium]
MGRIRLILFDLDGTLVDSSRDITNALNHAIAPLGLEPLSVEETVRLVGEGITRLIEKAAGATDEETKEDVLRRFLEFYAGHLTEHTRPYPGVPETLERLGSYRKAVISNKREELSRRLLSELGLDSHFAHILGSDSTPEKKPSPLPLLTVIETEGLTAENALMVGDSDLDIEAGRRAGVVTVGAAYGYRPLESLKDADFLMRESLVELSGIIETIEGRALKPG